MQRTRTKHSTKTYRRPYGLQSWSRRFDVEEQRRLAALNAAPKLLLDGEEQMLIERIGVDLDLNPFATAGDDREYRRGAASTHILCCS
ncbi:hypothetical protein IVB51_21615 [Bradyrhizobium sp. CW10]|nr:hypothetical protein [Bradyrhizobium sp. CW10]